MPRELTQDHVMIWVTTSDLLGFLKHFLLHFNAFSLRLLRYFLTISKPKFPILLTKCILFAIPLKPFSPMLLKREIIPMLLKRCLPYVTSSSRLDMQCQENGRRTMSRSAQILRGLFGFKVKSLYKNSLGSSVDYQGYCFGVFGRYSINTVPGPQQS